MKLNLTSIFGFIILILGLVVFLQYQYIDKITGKEPIDIVIDVPAKTGAIPFPKEAIPNIEYVYVPKIVGVDTELLDKYREEIDSLKKELLYKDAVTIREYTETFEDDNISMTVKSRVRGHLLDLTIPYYTIKPSKVTGTFTPKRDIDLFIGGELGIPTLPYTDFLGRVNVHLQIEKLQYSLGYDTQRRIWGGLSYKIL